MHSLDAVSLGLVINNSFKEDFDLNHVREYKTLAVDSKNYR